MATDDGMLRGSNLMKALQMFGKEEEEPRDLSVVEFTSEEWRMGNLGPALFALICIGIVVSALCCLSQFFAEAKVRAVLRASACVLIIIPVLYFSTVTYASTLDEISETRKYDETRPRRLGIMILLCAMIVLSIATCFVGEYAPMTMHMQGRTITSEKI